MCTIQNTLYKTGEGVAIGLGHPVEWRDIKTAGGVLPAFYKVRRCDTTRCCYRHVQVHNNLTTV